MDLEDRNSNVIMRKDIYLSVSYHWNEGSKATYDECSNKWHKNKF